MTEEDLSSHEPDRSSFPVAEAVQCATCGKPVDPLRAERIRIFQERFRYFCSEHCADSFDVAGLTPLPQPRRRRPMDANYVIKTHSANDDRLETRRQIATELNSVIHQNSFEVPIERVHTPLDPKLRETPDTANPPATVTEGVDVGTLLLTLAMLGGALSIALMLAGGSGPALVSRVVVVGVACGALVAQYVMGERDASEPHPLAMLAAPALATVTAIIAALSNHPDLGSALTLAALIIGLLALVMWLVRRARRPLDAERDQISLLLEHKSQRVVGEEIAPVRARDLRPGEEIVVDSGDWVPVDGVISAGSATMRPWLSAPYSIEAAESDSVVAGAQVLTGRIRVVVGWVGFDRTWLRLTNDPRRRADLLAPLARAGRLIAERGAPVAAGLAALTSFAANADLLTIALFALAAQAAIANPAIAQIPTLTVTRGVLEGLRRGIAFRSADALDTAGRVSIAVFCARGTLLLGEPEVANVEPVGEHDAARVLSLIAGAESGASDPVATAMLRAARARGVRPDGARSHSFQAGLGITAVSSNGQRLVVGSRALMLQERVSVASAEAKINELEGLGRSVLLVALGGRLVGVVGLQDGLRPGARAAVQYLVDVGVEPVLLSGDARETCEALGRALDIEHVRPEILPPDRGEEIRRLVAGGGSVAVVGRSPIDDGALGAADVSVALSSAGSTTAEWSIQLVSDDIKEASFAIRLAHDTRRDARAGLVTTLAPAASGALAVAFSLVPPAIAPLAAAAGALLGLYRLKDASP